MADSLRARLLGTWRLVEAVGEQVDGSPPLHPHGERPVGLIVYAEDGHMAVQIMERGRAVPSTADWTALTPDESAAEARTYFAYAGAFEVDEAAGTVTHHVELSLFPAWAGRTQVRRVEFRGGELLLASSAPILTGGALVTMRLRWERASD